MKVRRLKAIAEWINENMAGYSASIEEGYCNTDRKVGRLRIPGKGRRGNVIVVRHLGLVVFSHNSAQTYRSNVEVENWLKNERSLMFRKGAESSK